MGRQRGKEKRDVKKGEGGRGIGNGIAGYVRDIGSQRGHPGGGGGGGAWPEKKYKEHSYIFLLVTETDGEGDRYWSEWVVAEWLVVGVEGNM
jgi:hypothetical protein